MYYTCIIIVYIIYNTQGCYTINTLNVTKI